MGAPEVLGRVRNPESLFRGMRSNRTSTQVPFQVNGQMTVEEGEDQVG